MGGRDVSTVFDEKWEFTKQKILGLAKSEKDNKRMQTLLVLIEVGISSLSPSQ